MQYKKHHFRTGFEYSKKIERSYQIDPNNLWTAMRGITNFQIFSLDLENPIPVYNEGVFMDTVNYFRKYDAVSQFTFDKNLRKKLGLPEDGTDFILTDSYDMKNNTIQYYDKNGNLLTVDAPDDLFSLDMFSPITLIGFDLLSYNGYNYDGSKSKVSSDLYRFFKDGTSNPFSPIYSAFYIEDNFQYGNFSARVGLRLDYYNANQPVMKDKYSLYDTYKKSDVADFDGVPVNHPSNIGDDYVVYVDNANFPTIITGYRDGDFWYNADGIEILDPNDLDAGSGIMPYLKYPGVHIGDGEWKPDMSFESYKPVYSFLPQINLNYKFWRMNVYANYNSFAKNPDRFNVFRPEAYWVPGLAAFVENPDLKPYRTDKISLGANIKIHKEIYADLSVQKMIVSDYFSRYHLVGAYPYAYSTILNLTGKLKVNSITAAVAYLPTRPVGWNGNVSATKSFISDMDRAYLNIPDFVLNGNLAYSFGFGPDFVFRGNKILKAVFEGFNMGLFYQNRKGTRLTRPMYYDYNYEYTPNISFFNLRAEKGFYFRKTGLYVSAYVWVENLFNKQNFYYVDPTTGKPNDDGYLTDPNWQQAIENTNDPDSFRWLYQLKLNNPAYYAKPRIWRLGIIAKF
ncbi:MAG: TonB-dependent receptor [Chlorobi bacterium]|nr:TonB-dependent receptor [Chlorobiota bacterium]